MVHCDTYVCDMGHSSGVCVNALPPKISSVNSSSGHMYVKEMDNLRGGKYNGPYLISFCGLAHL